MRNPFRALASSKKATLNAHIQAENLTLSRYASSERHGVNHFLLSAPNPTRFPSPNPKSMTVVSWLCENNGMMGPDK